MLQISQQTTLRRCHSLRTRITPTFIHHNIFTPDDSSGHLNVRFTPTFASTVMDCQGYSSQTIHSKPQNTPQKDSTHRSVASVYENKAKQRKQAELNPCCHFVPENNYGIQTDPKIRVMEEVNFMEGRTSRMRKIVEQMSNPIFGSGYFWEPKSTVYHRESLKNAETVQQVPQQPKIIEKLNTQRSNEQAEAVQKEYNPKRYQAKKPEAKASSGKKINNTQNKVKVEPQKVKTKPQKLINRYKSAANLQKKVNQTAHLK